MDNAEEIRKLSKEVGDVKEGLVEVKNTIQGHGKKLEEFFKVLMEIARLEEKFISLEKRYTGAETFNTKDHDEIFKRLREIEILKPGKEDKPMTITVIWDIIKIIIAVLIALLVTGKLPVK
jgi:hypothetical protein